MLRALSSPSSYRSNPSVGINDSISTKESPRLISHIQGNSYRGKEVPTPHATRPKIDSWPRGERMSMDTPIPATNTRNYCRLEIWAEWSEAFRACGDARSPGHSFLRCQIARSAVREPGRRRISRVSGFDYVGNLQDQGSPGWT